jgi:hypothetical protein
MANRDRAAARDDAFASFTARNAARSGVRAGGVFTIVCRDKDGNVKWTDTGHNLVVNTGLNHIRDVILLAGTQVSTWYTGLTQGSPTIAAADTMASHAGWTESTAYSEAVRQTWTGAAGATGASSNSASPSVFSINATATIGGVFLTSNSTKGGSTGTLYSGVAFTGGNRSVVNGDTLTVTYNHSVADDGV